LFFLYSKEVFILEQVSRHGADQEPYDVDIGILISSSTSSTLQQLDFVPKTGVSTGSTVHRSLFSFSVFVLLSIASFLRVAMSNGRASCTVLIA
jgi:hypothetical protein